MVGCDHVVLASDGGQPENPTPPEMLWRLIDALAAEGLDRQALIACASVTPEVARFVAAMDDASAGEATRRAAFQRALVCRAGYASV